MHSGSPLGPYGALRNPELPASAATEATLRARSSDKCELCSAAPSAGVQEVAHSPESGAEACVLLCTTCAAQIDGQAELEPKHWFCLQEAIWSEVPAVQVTSWRLLHKLREQTWAHDLLEQAYLSDEVLSWAKAGQDEDGEEARIPTVDSNGTPLLDGDSVTLIKNLDVKGANFTAKQGTVVKNIRLTDNPEHVDGRVNKVAIVLKTCFLKKVSERS